MTSMDMAAGNGTQSTRYKRKLRNYLLDAGLQLRYTAAIVVVAVFLTAGLGYMIYQATRDTSRVIEMTALVDPVTAAQLQDGFSSMDTRVLWGIVGFGLVLVLSVSAVGILITHKIAGPLFNISNIVTKVRDNRLGPALRGLRKGDELQEFYGNVRDMHEALRRRVDEDVRVLGEAISALESLPGRSPAQESSLERLRVVRKEKEGSLEG
jgi:hypothetical protein